MVFFRIDTHSSSCGSVNVRGGAKRIMLPCVGLASKPFSLRAMHTSQAVAPGRSCVFRVMFPGAFVGAKLQREVIWFEI